MKVDKEEIEARLKKLVAKMRDWMAKDPKKNTQTELSRATGIGKATLSQLTRLVYTGKVKEHLHKLESFFDQEKERLAIVVEPDFCNTLQAGMALRFMSMIHTTNGLGVIIGSSGIGKTKTAIHYNSLVPNVFYVRATPLMRSRSGFMAELAHTLDVTGAGNLITLYHRLVAMLKQRGGMLVIDEAQVLTPENGSNTTLFELIRALYDEGIPVCLMGNYRLRDSVTVTKSEEFYQQLGSRLRLLEIPHTFKREDVDEVVNTLFVQGNRPSTEIMEYLHKVTEASIGSLRVAVNGLVLAVMRANTMEIPLTLSHVKDALRHIVAQEKPETKKQKEGTIHAKKKRNAA